MARYAEPWYLDADESGMNPRERYFARTMRAARLFREGRREEALRFLYEADAIAPALPMHLPVIAQAELEGGRPERAVAALERLLSPSFASDPAAVKQRLDFGSDAMDRLNRAPFQHLLGRSLAAAGRRDEALVAFADAARSARGQPREADYLKDLARALRDAGREEEARRVEDEAARLR